MELSKMPMATVKALVRANVEKVYEAFVKPEILSKFWLSAASDPLEVGKTVRWEFMVTGVADQVTTTELITNQKIKVAFSDSTTVEWTFESVDTTNTIVTVVNAGYSGSIEEQVEQALNSVEGFTWVLADLKTLLEQGMSAGIVKDKAWLIEKSMR